METQTKRRRKPKQNYKPSPLKDNCQTPPYAIVPIREYLLPHWRVWEPAAGEGYLARALQPHVKAVVSTDILAGHDFLADNPLALPLDPIHAIITNPPGSTKYKWLAQCCWYWRNFHVPFALLMPTDVLHAATGQRLIEAHDVEIIAPSKRISYKMPFKKWAGDSPFHSSWFTVGFNVGRRLTFFDMTPFDMTPPQESAPGVEQLALFDLDGGPGLRDPASLLRSMALDTAHKVFQSVMLSDEDLAAINKSEANGD